VLAEHPAGLPATTTLAVPHQSPAADGSNVVCDPGCRLAAWTIGEVVPPVTADVIAFTPFEVEPPMVTADPNRQVADGDTVTVRLERFTPGNVAVWQCLAVTPVEPDPRGCTPPATVTVPASGEAEAPLVYRETFTSETGQPWDCFSRCEVVVSTDDGPKPYLAALSSRPVAMSIYRDQWTTSIAVGLFAFPGTSASVAQCQVGVVHCSAPTTATLDAWGDGSVVLDQLSTYVAVDGTAVDCRTSDCVIAAFDGNGDNVAARGITYGPATLVLTPATDLHDLDAISGVVRGVDPGRLLQVTTCRRGTEAVFVRCGASTGTVTSDAIGRAELDTTAVQRFTTFAPARNQLCRDQCSIALVSPSGSVVAEAPYSMAVPSVSASPATGLGDGDAVTVAGSDLQPTYDGPTVLFPTGGWVVAQCDVAVGVNPSIVQLFEQCAVAPGGASVVVAGSTSSTAVTAQATISKILGGTTDCTASPGACVVGLARWEQDASTSTVFTPLTFG